MKHQLYNKIGQAVGEYDDSTKTYISSRDKSKGEIFIKKNWFEGKRLELPIAIDTPILQKLIQMGCKTIQVLIMGVKERSYMVSFSPEWILDNSININYDSSKMNKYGNQLVFDASKGVIGGIKQKALDIY